MNFRDKIILITGAAGQLGRATARNFIKKGGKVWLADSDETALDQASKDLPRESIIGSLVMDVSSQESVETAFSEITNKSSRLDVLINNAGIGVFTSFWDRNFTDFMHVMAVNAGGTFLCTREALKIMKGEGNGSIVNIGSIYGLVSSDPSIYTDCSRINSEAYSASKAAVIQLTKYFSVHAKEFGVRVNCVSPGGIFNNQGKDFVKNYSAKTPLGRMARYDEIVGAILFLSSSDADYVTGQNIIVDGGFTAW
jgi:NAD(P)-dependent dehydrogenase (short-subunit alcohol dehydrogenase family)